MTDYPEYAAPSLLKTINDGGALMMLPFLILICIWTGLVTVSAINRFRNPGTLFYLCACPVGFVLLAISQWAFHWQQMYRQVLISGFMDPIEYALSATAISRSTLLICGVGFVSLATAVLAHFLHSRHGSPKRMVRSEQAVPPNGP
jgi:hypothetical protein